MTFAEWLADAKHDFPKLTEGNCHPTSPVDESYNCIGWAADDNERWWWPDPHEQAYWPSAVPRIESVDCFVMAYSTLGYTSPTDGTLEIGKQKVAIFAKDDGRPTHAARQLPSGWWTSKLGPDIDIEHELPAIEGSIYGRVVIVLAREQNDD